MTRGPLKGCVCFVTTHQYLYGSWGHIHNVIVFLSILLVRHSFLPSSDCYSQLRRSGHLDTVNIYWRRLRGIISKQCFVVRRHHEVGYLQIQRSHLATTSCLQVFRSWRKPTMQSNDWLFTDIHYLHTSCVLFIVVGRGDIAVGTSDSQSRATGYESSCSRFETLAIPFMARCYSSLNCTIEYLATDRGAHVNK